jgi:hypothetical protein
MEPVIASDLLLKCFMIEAERGFLLSGFESVRAEGARFQRQFNVT